MLSNVLTKRKTYGTQKTAHCCPATRAVPADYNFFTRPRLTRPPMVRKNGFALAQINSARNSSHMKRSLFNPPALVSLLLLFLLTPLSPRAQQPASADAAETEAALRKLQV